jgi:uncharacterized protein
MGATEGGTLYKPSRFNLVAWEGSDDASRTLLVYNSLASSFTRFSQPTADRVASLLDGKGLVGSGDDVLAGLVEQGVLVDQRLDELEMANAMQRIFKARRDSFNLILMPTEKCFFRCVYCYEDFAKGKMPRDVRQGILRLAQREIDGSGGLLRRFKVDWFGGEPLSARDVIRDISTDLMAVCEERGVEYSSSMTTNGFLLDETVANECLDLKISRFQITLDGPPETHDRLRVLRNGKGTFERIMGNLTALRRLERDFNVRLRVNFTPEVAKEIPSFLHFLGERFGNDPRFSVWFHPVGHWGGPHDEELEICDQRTSEELELEFMTLAAESGFSLSSWREAMQPYGSVCYAADPRSYVIGSDGSVYKCTVAFKEPENLVGHLDRDGDMHLSDERMATWVSSGEETDSGCQACGFRPACHGNACPLERLNRGGQRACPPAKKHMGEVLTLLASHPGR